jgi:sensor histidine kinase YesM
MKKTKIIIHSLIWLLYLIYTFLISILTLYRSNNNYQFDVLELFDFTMLLFFLKTFILFYFSYFVLTPKLLLNKRFYSYLFSAIIIALILLEVNYGMLFFEYKLKSMFFLAWLSDALTNIIYVVLGSFVYLVFKWIDDNKKQQALEQKHLNTQLALVKAQTSPHFLFNTLNNIDVLIENEPSKASEYLNKLSDILRFMLYDSSEELIPIQQELDYINKYVELQKLRTSNKDYVKTNFLINSENVEVAPMIFIPFIENAFKHTTNKKVKNAIIINFEVNHETIIFECINKFTENKSTDKRSGIGLELIQNRLDLIYGDNYKIDIAIVDKNYKVFLTIKITD